MGTLNILQMLAMGLGLCLTLLGVPVQGCTPQCPWEINLSYAGVVLLIVFAGMMLGEMAGLGFPGRTGCLIVACAIAATAGIACAWLHCSNCMGEHTVKATVAILTLLAGATISLTVISRQPALQQN